MMKPYCILKFWDIEVSLLHGQMMTQKQNLLSASSIEKFKQCSGVTLA